MTKSYGTKCINLKAYHTLLIGDEVRIQLNHKKSKKADIVVFAPEEVKILILKNEEGEE